jgi:hypothetical protein
MAMAESNAWQDSAIAEFKKESNEPFSFSAEAAGCRFALF